MIKAINQWCFPGDFSAVKCIETAAELGFEGFEPALADAGQVSLTSSPGDIAAVVKAAGDNGIKLTSLATGLYWKHSLSSLDAAMRKGAQEIVKKQLDCAAALGVDAILVVPGVVDADTPYDVAYKHAQDSINAVIEHARGTGVVIGIENVWNKFLLSPMEMRAFVTSFSSPFVKAYFDVGNVLNVGYPEQWISILGKEIVKIHIKDFRVGVGTFGGFVDLLSGDVNFPRVIEALKAVGYDDAVIAEISPAGHYPLEGARRTSYAMDMILGK